MDKTRLLPSGLTMEFHMDMGFGCFKAAVYTILFFIGLIYNALTYGEAGACQFMVIYWILALLMELFVTKDW